MMKQIRVPNHIAIIPDGNRRWAKEKGLPTFEGHRRGFETVFEIGKKARQLGIKILTFWAFSTENWQRTSEEINYLMELYEAMIDKNLEEALKEKIRVIHLGRKDRISPTLKQKIIDAEEKTKEFNRYYLCIALDYGGRDEIIRAISKIRSYGVEIRRNIEEDFKDFLDTKDLPYPYPDLVIRTGGETRTSGFMIWQTAYTEWIFVKKYFPDFIPDDLEECIQEYFKRERRFGK